jgi:serpin B
MKPSVAMQKCRGGLLRATKWVLLAGLLVLLAYQVDTVRSDTSDAEQVSDPTTTAVSSNAMACVQGNTAFALELYARLKGTNGNLLFSPWRISSCMAMTFAGARGNTERQMAAALHFDANQTQVHAAFAELRHFLVKPGRGIELNMADGVWAQAGHPFLPSFLDVLSRSYDAEARLVDFRSQASSVAPEINEWVASHTKGRFRDVVAPESLTGDTRLVLVDAVYFKGVGQTKFNADATKDFRFYRDSRHYVNCRMMSCTGRFRYGRNPDCELIELPYGSGAFSMLVLLPGRGSGLSAEPIVEPIDTFPDLELLESKLTPENLSSWLASARWMEQPMDVALPKFNFRTSTSLPKVLAGMGMPDAFRLPEADFSGMDGMTDLYVSVALHDAFVEVSEEGTTAGAVTQVHMSRGAGPPQFMADHPFVFLIRDNRTGVVLFLGRVTDPTAS